MPYTKLRTCPLSHRTYPPIFAAWSCCGEGVSHPQRTKSTLWESTLFGQGIAVEARENCGPDLPVLDSALGAQCMSTGGKATRQNASTGKSSGARARVIPPCELHLAHERVCRPGRLHVWKLA